LAAVSALVLITLFYVGAERVNLFFSSVLDLSLTVRLDTPKNIQVTNLGDYSAEVSWVDIPLPSGGGYEVYYKPSLEHDYSDCPTNSSDEQTAKGCAVSPEVSQVTISGLQNDQYDFLVRSFIGEYRSSATDCESCEATGVLVSANDLGGRGIESNSIALPVSSTQEYLPEDIKINPEDITEELDELDEPAPIPEQSTIFEKVEEAENSDDELDEPETIEAVEDNSAEPTFIEPEEAEAKDKSAIDTQQPSSTSTIFSPKTSVAALPQTKNVPSSENLQFEEFSHGSAREPPAITLFNLFVGWLADNEVIRFTKFEQTVRITFFGVRLQLNISQLIASLGNHYCDAGKNIIEADKINCDILGAEGF
jgi:hypothetical protein